MNSEKNPEENFREKENNSRKKKLRVVMYLISAANMLLFWFWIGFTGGAGVLFFVATPIEEYFTSAGTNLTVVNIILSAVALVWIFFSGSAALFIARRLTTRRAAIFGHIVGLIASIIVFGIFLQAGAGLFARFRGETTEVSERFTFGPHPDLAAMQKLRGEGYTGILTLLSPFVPFEAVLLAEERRNAVEAGIELIEAPMLPWISSNEESLALIRNLAASDTGRYYVHCYLGRHRAELARQVIFEAIGLLERGALVDEFPPRFSRGRIFLYGDTIAIGPLPTRDEWFEKFIPLGIRRVLALVDPAELEPAWFAEEAAWAAASGIELKALPLGGPEEARRVLAVISGSSDPIYIHSYLNDERTRLLRGFIDPNGDYAKPARLEERLLAGLQLPKVKPGRVNLPARLERGPIKVIDGRIGIGPLPTSDEWKGRIAEANVRLVISLLNPEVPDDVPWINEERAVCERLGIGFLLVPVRYRTDILPILGAIRSIEGNIYIHGFGVEDRIDWVRELVGTTRSLPQNFERGAIAVMGQVHFGPLPTSEEWGAFIARSDIRTVVLLIDPDDPKNESWLDQVEDDARLTGIRVVIPENRTDIAQIVGSIAELEEAGFVYVLTFSDRDPLLARVQDAWRTR